MSEQVIQLHDSGVRRLKAKARGWLRWFLDYTFHVKRQDGSTDKTAVAWRGFQTTANAAMITGLIYIINLITGMHDNTPITRLEKRMTDVEEKMDDLTREVRYVKGFMKGLDVFEPKVENKNK
jgi:hypothetical protein